MGKLVSGARKLTPTPSTAVPPCREIVPNWVNSLAFRAFHALNELNQRGFEASPRNGIQEVRGSIPLRSTIQLRYPGKV